MLSIKNIIGILLSFSYDYNYDKSIEDIPIHIEIYINSGIILLVILRECIKIHL